MYCVKCGVELDDAEKVCPLCGLKVYHPDLKLEEAKKSYPISKVPSYETVNKQGILLLITAALMVPVVICILCDIAITGSFSWSGYVLGGILLFYVCGVLPAWFKNPNPVIFVPAFFAAVVLFLLYVDIATGVESRCGSIRNYSYCHNRCVQICKKRILVYSKWLLFCYRWLYCFNRVFTLYNLWIQNPYSVVYISLDWVCNNRWRITGNRN